MRVADFAAFRALGFDRGGDCAVSGAPRDDQQIALGIAGGFDIRNFLGDGRDLGGADTHHVFVV